MLYSGTDPEAYTTEYALVQEDKLSRRPLWLESFSTSCVDGVVGWREGWFDRKKLVG